MASQMAIAATSRVSIRAAEQVARAGGNAVDVAVAAALTTMATEPAIVSPGGGAYISIWAADEEPLVIDGNVEMPGRGLPASRFGRGITQVVTDYGGGVTMGAGHGAVATPGSIPACALAIEEHGRMPWADVVAPAAAACREGYPTSTASATYLSFTAHTLFALDPQALALVTRPDGTPLQAGDIGRNPMLADVLDLVARDGASVVMTGEVGRALTTDMEAHGGLITPADLADYVPAIRTPVRRRIGSWDFAFNPPPNVGGVMLAVMMGELGKRGDWHWPDVIEIQRKVLAYRLSVHDVQPDLEHAGHALLQEVDRHGLEGLPTSSSTANVSVVDSNGLACAITCSFGYSAGITIPDTGLVLNNALGEPELNRLGLHALAPGTRLASNMSPVTGHTDDGRAIAIGSPGADRITTALMQVIGQGCLHGMDLRHAITAPRVHVSFGPDRSPTVEFETDADIAQAIATLGLSGRDHGASSMYFGGVGAAYRMPGGSLEAAGDPRRTGETIVLDLP